MTTSAASRSGSKTNFWIRPRRKVIQRRRRCAEQRHGPSPKRHARQRPGEASLRPGLIRVKTLLTAAVQSELQASMEAEPRPQRRPAARPPTLSPSPSSPDPDFAAPATGTGTVPLTTTTSFQAWNSPGRQHHRQRRHQHDDLQVDGDRPIGESHQRHQCRQGMQVTASLNGSGDLVITGRNQKESVIIGGGDYDPARGFWQRERHLSADRGIPCSSFQHFGQRQASGQAIRPAHRQAPPAKAPFRRWHANAGAPPRSWPLPASAAASSICWCESRYDRHRRTARTDRRET